MEGYGGVIRGLLLLRNVLPNRCLPFDEQYLIARCLTDEMNAVNLSTACYSLCCLSLFFLLFSVASTPSTNHYIFPSTLLNFPHESSLWCP